MAKFGLRVNILRLYYEICRNITEMSTKEYRTSKSEFEVRYKRKQHLTALGNLTSFELESKETNMHRLIDQNKSKEKAKSISPNENNTKRKPDNKQSKNGDT